jgi:hypothetical protein
MRDGTFPEFRYNCYEINIDILCPVACSNYKYVISVVAVVVSAAAAAAPKAVLVVVVV